MINIIITAGLLLPLAPPPAGPTETDAGRNERAPADSRPVDAGSVVVTGARGERRQSESVVATEVIDAAQVRSSGGRSLAQVLEEWPGLELERNAAGTSVRLLGLDPQHVLVLVDGEPLVGRFRGALDLERVGAADIERVEIVRGPTSALYGSDALGGVIHVITRTPRRPLDVESTLSGGLNGRFGLGASAQLRRPAALASASVDWSRGDAIDLDPADEATTLSAYDTLSVSGRVGIPLGARFTLTARGAYGLRDQTGVDRSGAGALFDRRLRVQTGTASLEAVAQLGTRCEGAPCGDPDSPRPEDDDPEAAVAELVVSASYARYLEDYVSDQRNAAALDEDQRSTHDLVRLSVHTDAALASEHQLVAGLEALYERLLSPRLDGAPERWRGALFAQYEWTLRGGPVAKPDEAADLPRHSVLGVVAGARVDLDSQFGVFATPKLSLRYQPTRRWVLRTGVGLGFRAPTFSELYLRFENPGVGYVVTGNEALAPERSVGVNVSVDVQALRWLGLEVAAYWNGLDDLIAVERQAVHGAALTPYITSNVAEAWTAGLDVNLSLRPLPSLRIVLGYSLLETRDVGHDRPLERRARHRATAALRWGGGLRGFEASLRCALTGPSPVYEDADGDGVDEVRQADAFATLDARIALVVIPEHLTVFVQGENLLGAGDPVDLPIPPLSVSAGLTGRY